MRILKMISQHRRDFWADLVCEHCGAVEKKQSGYDDSYFHDAVLPKRACKACGETSPDSSTPAKPKYPDTLQL